jgi:hypothetical protein
MRIKSISTIGTCAMLILLSCIASSPAAETPLQLRLTREGNKISRIQTILSDGVKSLVRANCKLTEASNESSAERANADISSGITDLILSENSFNSMSNEQEVRAIVLHPPQTKDTQDSIEILKSSGLSQPNNYGELLQYLGKIVDGEINDLSQIEVKQEDVALNAASIRIFNIRTTAERLFRALVTLSITGG